jgi:hypothetical protein
VNLKAQLRETEKKLTEQLDPEVYKNLKMIICREMKDELEQMKNDDSGCSDKCRVRNRLAECEINRNHQIVSLLMQF